MVSKHGRTRAALLAEPPPTTFPWREIEAMFVHHGVTVEEGKGSAVRFRHARGTAVFHRPQATGGLLRAVRAYCQRIGLTAEGSG